MAFFALTVIHSAKPLLKVVKGLIVSLLNTDRKRKWVSSPCAAAGRTGTGEPVAEKAGHG